MQGDPVDIRSGGTWIAVTDTAGRLLSTTATEGGTAVTLASCRRPGTEANCFFVPEGQVPQNLSVELPSGSRQKLVIAAFDGNPGGYVVAGRMVEPNYTRLVETLRLIVATWLSGLACFLMGNRLIGKR